MLKHANPQPLKMAADLVKKFIVDLGPRLSPEQRRDFARLQALIEEAERHYGTQLAVARSRSATGAGY